MGVEELIVLLRFLWTRRKVILEVCFTEVGDVDESGAKCRGADAAGAADAEQRGAERFG